MTDTMTQAQNKANCLLLRGGRTLAATVDAYLTLPPTLNSHDRTVVVIFSIQLNFIYIAPPYTGVVVKTAVKEHFNKKILSQKEYFN